MSRIVQVSGNGPCVRVECSDVDCTNLHFVSVFIYR